mgnify:FL=1
MACSNCNCCFVAPMKSGMVISGMRGMAKFADLDASAEAATVLAEVGAVFEVLEDCSFSAEQALSNMMHSAQTHGLEVEKAVISCSNKP